MLPRIHLPADAWRHGASTRIELFDEQSHYLLRVLRLRQGQMLEVFDGEGRRRNARLIEVARQTCQIELEDDWRLTEDPASRVSVIVLQGISSAEKMDWTVEKAVELGADAVIPVMAERCVVRLDATRARRRHEHWQRLVVAACMQCGRDRLPHVAEAVAPEQALRVAQALRQGSIAGPAVLEPANGDVPTQPISQWADAMALKPPATIILAVGPESGWSASELALMQAQGLQPVSMGERVLRTETAALAALAALQMRFGPF